MYKYLVIAVIAVFTLTGPAQALPPIILATHIDIYERFGQPSKEGVLGDIVINSVRLNRAQPPNSGEAFTLSSGHVDTQIGWAKSGGREILIVLEGTNIEQFVRDATTLAFNRAGYAVVPAGVPRAENAPTVDIELTSLWMWVTTINAWGRKEFHFNIETTITSDVPELANIGTVNAYGSRTGSYEKNSKSYRNTILHSLKFFIDKFEENVRASVVAYATNNESRGGTTMANLSETLTELVELRDAGTISDEEYEKLRTKAVEDALR